MEKKVREKIVVTKESPTCTGILAYAALEELHTICKVRFSVFPFVVGIALKSQERPHCRPKFIFYTPISRITRAPQHRRSRGNFPTTLLNSAFCEVQTIVCPFQKTACLPNTRKIRKILTLQIECPRLTKTKKRIQCGL